MTTFKNAMDALYFGSEEDYFQLIDSVKDVNIIEKEWDTKYSLLQIAVANGHFEAAKDLIKRGADVNFHNGRNTALIISVFNQQPVEFTRLLIENGADVNAIDSPHKNNALWYALAMLRGDKCKYFDNIIELLKYGADPFNVNKHGLTPLSWVEDLPTPELKEIFAPYLKK
jgi:ankyrin repeat protein